MSTYRSLVRIAGPGLLILTFLARLPAAMAPLGVIMLVSSVTGSFAQAGLVTAGLGIGAAAGGPAVGWLTDRYGQRPVGVVAALVNALALGVTVWAVVSGAGVAITAALAAVVGMATPQIGPLIRVRWAAILPRRDRSDLLPTAMAYEGAADEASFVAGPALVGLLAVLGLPALPLIVAVGLGLAAALPFALHRTAEPRAATRSAARLPYAVLALLMAAMLAIGVVFGATQTGITAFASSIDHAGAAGLVYAILGVGSAAAGFATAWLPARFTLARRFQVFAAALLLGASSLLAVHSLWVAAAAMIVVGVTAAPLLVTVYGLAGRAAPAGRAGLVMTLLASGIVAGVALGAGIAGSLAESHGYSGALAVPLAAGLLAVGVAAIGRRTVHAVPA